MFRNKLKKITQRLSFGYCEGVCREFFLEKCENRASAVGHRKATRGHLFIADEHDSMPSTHKKVIVRKMDRDSVSGYVAPAQFVHEGKLELLNTAGTVIAIDLREIKGVYFVREFGDSESLSRKTFTSRPRAEGLWVRLRFKDNEILEGLMPADLTQSTPEGFLINPPDQRSNTQRIFVPRTALDSLTVLAVIGAGRRQRRPPAADQRQVPMFGE
jgi:Family of unknown function (DUF6982)